MLNSNIPPVSATATATGAGVANIGSPNITFLGSDNYVISFPCTIANNQNLPTTYTIQLDLKLYTTNNFISALTTSYSMPLSGPLPVEFISFSGEYRDAVVILKWETASEVNSDFFIVERSTDGENWSEVGKILASGNSQEIIEYTFEDKVNSNLKLFYRLKQVDFDGTFDFSEIIQINPVKQVPFIVSPNPTSGRITLPLNFDHLNVTNSFDVTISNLSGQELYRKNFNTAESSIEIDLTHFNPGIYVLNLIMAGEIRNVRVVKY